MSNTEVSSADRRRQVHTEVRVPIETVMTRVVWFIFGVIEVLIAIRFVLMFLGANASTGFVQMIYGVSNIFMAPFIAIFKTVPVSTFGAFEWSALAAIAIYALVAWGLTALIYAVTPRVSAQTVERVVQDDDTRAK